MARPVLASAARSAAGRPVKRTNGFVPAATSGTHSTPEACAQPAYNNGLRPNAYPPADGRRIRSGMRTDEICLLNTRKLRIK